MACNCPDSESCEQLQPLVVGSGLMAVDSNNCPYLLVPIPGSVVYSDGSVHYYADGSVARPLSFPGLLSLTAIEGAEVPKLLFQANGGVVGALAADPDTDGLILRSVGGQWQAMPLEAISEWPQADITEECCCPAAFAVLVEDGDNYALRRFNPCTDATTVSSGAILTCDGDCMRKLDGGSDNNVPIWDAATEEWVPGDVSTLVPTPESVLDVAQFRYSASGTEADMTAPYTPFNFFTGNNGGWSFVQSGTLASSVAYANASDAAAQALNVINAGWYQVTCNLSGTILLDGVTPDPGLYSFQVQITPSSNNASISGTPESFGTGAIVSVEDTGVYNAWLNWSGTVCFAANLTANSRIQFAIVITAFNAVGDTNVYEAGDWTCNANGILTRIS